METHLDPAWARERIIRIVEALGKKAKLSIISEFYFGAIALALTHALKLSVGVAIWVLFRSTRLLFKAES